MSLAETLRQLLEQIADSAYQASEFASHLKLDDNTVLSQSRTVDLPAKIASGFIAVPGRRIGYQSAARQCADNFIFEVNLRRQRSRRRLLNVPVHVEVLGS